MDILHYFFLHPALRSFGVVFENIRKTTLRRFNFVIFYWPSIHQNMGKAKKAQKFAVMKKMVTSKAQKREIKFYFELILYF
ncbi:unnamed protein product, partial [Vitis vinifera]|uniref:Uncharacterized protein n=1 Tax=Vitis vinifera TaxID=29760 RepID=D7UC99_VITVI